MRELILIKNGEIALKGLNRNSFEDKLIKNAKRSLAGCGQFKFYKAQSTIYCEPVEEGADMAGALERLQKVFGIAALCRAAVVEKDFEAIKATAAAYLKDTLRAARTFKVEAKRSDKSFAMASPEICRELGGYLLSQYPHLRVDVHRPDVTVTVEIRDFGAYLHTDQLPGAGGIPVGSGGKAMLLISGGIDSPVAGYMMAKRGLELEAVHFAAPPYTSERARLKVIRLCEKLLPYAVSVRLYVVGFTEIQVAIRQNCPEDLFTLIMRRQMMKIAERLAEENRCEALITGESVGQVASQTMQALAVTDIATRLPVLRPVIGMDKTEIIRIARQIDTFETSILPYEDCCTVFTPRHPKTKPRLGDILKAEERLDVAAQIDQAVREAEVIQLCADWPRQEEII